MPNVIDISLELVDQSPVEIALNYSVSPPVNIQLTEPAAPAIEINFANIGPRGPQGQGAATSIDVVANEDVSKYQVVTGDGRIANSNTLAHRNKIVGIALADIANGFSGSAQAGGSITNNSWAWVPGDRIFLNGSALSTVAPDSGFIVQIGVASAANAINIEVQPSILL